MHGPGNAGAIGQVGETQAAVHRVADDGGRPARQQALRPPYDGRPMARPPIPPLRLQLLSAPRLLAGVDGTALHLGSRKALLLLAWLALEGGATRERLATLLWPEADAAGGRRNLRREIFRLRELALPLCEAADGTLSLDAAQISVDALQLLHEQRLPETSGPALEGLDGVGSPELDLWLQRWRLELAQRHGLLLARQADQHEAAGALAEALALHRQRLAADPCHEAAALAVMRLQATLGDRAGALLTHQRLAEALRDELDLAPGAAVQALVHSLRQAADAEAPAGIRSGPQTGPSGPGTAPVGLPGVAASTSLPAVPPFVPRGAAQARIEAAWARGQRVYLHGAAGIGKTRLASELAAARGPWLRVACEPQDAALPYASVLRLLRALREAAPDVALPEWVRRELAQLMPEFGPAPEALATDEARRRLLAAMAEAWRLLVADNFSALVLDDWHWGDAASLELWSRLDEAGGSGTSAVAWIIAFRSAQLPPAALQRQRAEVDGGRGLLVALDGMDPDEVLALTRALSGSPGGRLFSQRLQSATEGNPFFLLETLRHLLEQGLIRSGDGGWSTPFDEHTQDYAELPVPPSVRAAVLARVHALGTPVLRLLELACLCRGPIDARLLAEAAGQDEEQVIHQLEHAQAAQLLHDGRGGWHFAHDLVRQALQQGLSAARQRLLHARLAQPLQVRAEAAPARAAASGLAAELASHWEAAGQPDAALPWRVAAAEAALRVHALDEGLAHYAQALADGARDEAALAIHLACAQVHGRRADRQAADQSLDQAAAVAADVSREDPERGRAALLQAQIARAEHLRETDRGDEALALLDALAPLLERAPPMLRAQGLTALAGSWMLLGRLTDTLTLLRQAVALLEGLPDARPQLGALQLTLTRTLLRCGDLHGAALAAAQAVASHELLDAPIGLAHALVLRSVAHIHLGEREAALAALERARDLARRSGNVPSQRGAILNLVKLHVDGGDTATGVALLDEGESLSPAYEHRRAEQAFLEARFFLHLLRGEVAEADARAERLLAFARQTGGPSERLGACHLVVDLYLLQGDLARARTLLAEAQGWCEQIQAEGQGSHYGPQQALKRAWLALAEGQPAQTLALLPEASSLQRLEDRFGAAWLGAAAALALARPALARQWLDTGRLDEEVALDQYGPWLQQQLALAQALGEPAPPGVVERTRALLAQGRIPALLVGGLSAALNACSTPPA